MVGMLQIVTYLLCVYLVFKGVEIFQIALASQRTDGSRTLALIIGGVMIAISILAAIIFAIWITDQAVGVSVPGR
ncbi:MAG TPA: hypothetical protein VFS76_10690 [Pyrinomonadaceae bacterium]|nr:hypothetical protein [Pyrinomonadaceae bacterium]